MSRPAPAASPPADPVPKPRRSLPILVYLGFLMLVIVVPALGFTGILLRSHNQAQEEIVETFTVATTRSVVQAIEREIAGMITALRVLMNAESLVEGDLERFHAHAQAALSGTGTHLALINGNNVQLLNTRMPYGTVFGRVSDPALVQRARETSDAIVSPLLWSETAEDFVFIVMKQRSGSSEVVLVTQTAASLANALLSRELPAGWHVALVDGDNTVIAASQNSAVVGEKLFIPLDDGPGSTMGWHEETIGGEDYKTITQRSILTGWYVVAWAPVAVVASPLRTTLLWLLLGAVAIVGLAAIAAAFVARQIAGSVRGLAREARHLGRGEDIAPTDYPVRELAQVSAALADAASKRREAETEIRFLLRELAHRSKNQLTVISAMAKQTAHGTESVEQFVDSFQHRIYGLARSTDLLLAHGTQGIALRDLFKTQIDPFRPEDPARVVKTGPNVRLNVQAAQVLGMAAHELATNAAKYGAFSLPEGRLEVHWNRAGGGRLHLSWREYVPGFAPPAERSGFGTVVLKTMVGGALKADVERIVHADGIEWIFSIPLAQIDPDREQAGLDDGGEDA